MKSSRTGLLDAGVPDDAPDPLGRRRHLHMRDAEFRQRIDDGVDDDRQCRRGPGLPAGANAERIAWSRHLAERSDEGRQFVRARHPIIRERGRQQLSGARLVDALLPERLADALNDPAVDLALEDHWIDRPSYIVDGCVANNVRRSRLGIDLDLADVAAVRKAADLEDLVMLG